MRKKAFIKILFIILIGFWLFNTNTFANQPFNKDQEEFLNQTDENQELTPQQKCEKWTPKWERVSSQFCECPEWSKNIDGACRSCAEPDVCCGIQLNTKVPFIGDCIELTKKCIDGTCPNWYKCDEKSNKCRVEKTDPNQTVIDEAEAFPTLMGWLIRILVTIIMLWSFMAILAGGVMISAAWSDEQRATKGKKLIIDVVIALAILGASGVILRLINPNFFW